MIDPKDFERIFDPNAIRRSMEERESRQSQQLLKNIGPSIPQQMFAIAKENLASEFCKRLNTYCEQFDKELDPEHEVGARLVTYGQAVEIYVDGIDGWDPSLIRFHGVRADEKSPVQLIQHVSQISFLLIALPKKNPEGPKEPFGFAGNVPQKEGD